MILKPGDTLDKGTGPPQALTLNRWKGAGKKMALAAQIGGPMKPPPPPPSLWDIMSKQHTLIAAITPPSQGSDDNQLRDTQLVQAFFNTLFLELMVIHILAARMSEHDVALNSVQAFVAGTLAAFLCCVGTIVCKLVFRWGNVHRRRVRKGPPRIVEFFRWLVKELKGKETLFHGVQTLWYEYRTTGTKRTPKKAIKKNVVVLRGYLAWFLNLGAALTAIVLCVYYGIIFDYGKARSALHGWAWAFGETFLLVEPIVIGIIFVTPRLIDRAVLPDDAREALKPPPVPNFLKFVSDSYEARRLRKKKPIVSKSYEARMKSRARKYKTDLSA